MLSGKAKSKKAITGMSDLPPFTDTRKTGWIYRIRYVDIILEKLKAEIEKERRECALVGE